MIVIPPRKRPTLLLGKVFPTARMLDRHVIIAIPKITIGVIMMGIGLSFLLSACQYVNSL